MESDAAVLANLVLKQPPIDLLAYLWSFLHLAAMHESEEVSVDSESRADKTIVLATLEYVHAVWSSFGPSAESEGALNEEEVGRAIELVNRLRSDAMAYSLSSSLTARDAQFGATEGLLDFNAKSAWILIRGNRYQVLEQEFFEFVLAPHEETLREAYGVGAKEVAAGIQAIATSMREGINDAMIQLASHMMDTETHASQRGMSIEDALRDRTSADPFLAETMRGAMQDVMGAGLCNLSRHTQLPVPLLEDLSYGRGDNSEFFGEGPFRGTLLKTLPARIKPLIRLDGDFYATDGAFVRDSAYRALERGVLARRPHDRERWNRERKAMTEAAFHRIFAKQLRGAVVLTDVYYRDPATGEWTEADAVILVDDVLIQVEAKAGVGAMHSPATHAESHFRAVQNLVMKAHEQTRRFFNYLASAPSVVLYTLRQGRYEPVHTLTFSRFRVALPIGLTVESFAPFSTMCKELPTSQPNLGVHPFISMSIDDLFVLNRFLPTTGALMHYLEVRQKVAGIGGARLFDELDHLGAYLEKNRFDLDLRSQLARMNHVAWDGFCAPVDQYFARDDWRHQPAPSQSFPPELAEILSRLEENRQPGWLAVDSRIRDLGSDDREGLAAMIRRLAETLQRYPRRWFVSTGNGVRTLLIWLFRHGEPPSRKQIVRQAEVVALATDSEMVHALCVSASPAGAFTTAFALTVARPGDDRSDLAELARDASTLTIREQSLVDAASDEQIPGEQTTRRNDPCWCGSGRKLKRCHGQ